MEGLDDLHSYVKLGNYVSRFAFPPMEMKKIAVGIQPRVVPDSDLWFDPLHPKKPDADEAVPTPTVSTKDVQVLALVPKKNQPNATREKVAMNVPSPALQIETPGPTDHSHQL